MSIGLNSVGFSMRYPQESPHLELVNLSKAVTPREKNINEERAKQAKPIK